METYTTNQTWRLNPLNDFLFFKIMGEKGDEIQLLSFLNAVLEIHFIDMVKWRRLPKKDVEKNVLHRWLTWLDQRSPPELIKELKNMDSAIDKADERMVYVTGDKEAIRAYEMRMMGLSDWNSAKNYERREGREEKAQEIALKMKNLNLPIAQIAECTGLSPEAILSL